jgi:general stress protein YciG
MAQAQNQAGGVGTRVRGFAKMDPEKQREIASKGGRAAHQRGTAHEFNTEEAREAGRKGGQAVSRDRAHMAEIGRRGGEASGGRRGRVAPPESIQNSIPPSSLPLPPSQ